MLKKYLFNELNDDLHTYMILSILIFKRKGKKSHVETIRIS
jgi:hypothetical protein